MAGEGGIDTINSNMTLNIAPQGFSSSVLMPYLYIKTLFFFLSFFFCIVKAAKILEIPFNLGTSTLHTKWLWKTLNLAPHMETEATIRKAAAREARKSCNNLWKETMKEEKETSCVCIDFISPELNLISRGNCERVIIRISYKVAVCQLCLIISLQLLPSISPSLFSAAENNETRAWETSQQTILDSGIHLHEDQSQILSDHWWESDKWSISLAGH